MSVDPNAIPYLTSALVKWFDHELDADPALKNWASGAMTPEEIWCLAALGVMLNPPSSTGPTGPPTPTGPTGPPPSGGGKLLPFTDANWPRKYGNCGKASPDGKQLRIDLTTACNPAGDGHYRTDWSNLGTFKAGTTSFVSVPVAFPSVPAVGSGSWWQFAEAKTPNNPGGWAEWGLYVVTASGGAAFNFKMGRVTGSSTNGTSHPTLWQGGNPADGWNTFAIESNYSTTKNGFLNLYLNGTKVWSCSGVLILAEAATDLDLNAYTGGSPVPSTVIHGAPLLGTTLASVEQPGGWRAAP